MPPLIEDGSTKRTGDINLTRHFRECDQTRLAGRNSPSDRTPSYRGKASFSQPNLIISPPHPIGELQVIPLITPGKHPPRWLEKIL